MVRLENYLPSTVLNLKHPRAIALKKHVEGFLSSYEGTLRDMSISGAGVAVLDITGDAAQKKLVEEFNKLPDVVVSEISGFDMQLQQNRAQEAKVQKKRAKTNAKVTAA